MTSHSVVVLLHGPDVLGSGCNLSSGAFKGLEPLVMVKEEFLPLVDCQYCFPLHLPHLSSCFSSIFQKVIGIVQSSDMGSTWGIRG
jgi:hypothetical protein